MRRSLFKSTLILVLFSGGNLGMFNTQKVLLTRINILTTTFPDLTHDMNKHLTPKILGQKKNITLGDFLGQKKRDHCYANRTATQDSLTRLNKLTKTLPDLNHDIPHI